MELNSRYEVTSIIGADRVIDWFGEWPHLHDARIDEFQLGSDGGEITFAWQSSVGFDGSIRARDWKVEIVPIQPAAE